MKKTLLIFPLFLLLLNHTVTAQVVDIPDPHFKWALLHPTEFGNDLIDTNGDGEIQVSEAEVVDSLHVTGATLGGGSFNPIADLTGIEAFTNLVYLDCTHNALNALDLSQNNNLEEVGCQDNQLTSLQLGDNPNLTELYCYNNFLTSLDVGQNTGLEKLKCTNNNLTSLQVSQNLKILASGNNQLTYLDLSEDDSLVSFSAKNNQLTSLDIRNNNNENIDFFSTENNPDLTCIFVDDEDYWQNNWGGAIGDTAHFVETQQECDALGVESFNLKKIKIYPNPVKDVLYIQTNSKFKIQIFNLQGKKLFFKNSIKTNESIDCSSLSSGIYFLKISSQNHTITRKIIKL